MALSFARPVTLIATLTLIAAACSSSSPEPAADGAKAGFDADQANTELAELAAELDLPISDAAPPPAPPEAPGGASGYSHFVFEEVGGEVVPTVVEGPQGDQTRVEWSYLDLKELAESGDAVPDELNMTRAELEELVGQLDAVRDGTEKYQDIAAARADGYVQTTNEVPNMGAHFNNFDRTSDVDFDPAEPDILMYKTDDAGEWELIGTSFVLSRGQVGDDHPEAFAGPLDNWHVHYNLCSGNPAIASRSATAAECRAGGGSFIPSYGWMIHAWVWEDNPLGAFHMWNPNVPPEGVTADQILESRTAASDGPASSIANFAFGEVTASVGEEVTWSNVDSVPHTVTTGTSGVGDGLFDSGVFAPGQSFSASFDQAGEYTVTCTLHPSMTGLVTVG